MLVILAITTLISAIGWAANKLAFMTVIAFMIQKGYTPPSDEETRACTRIVIRSMLKDNRTVGVNDYCP